MSHLPPRPTPNSIGRNAGDKPRMGPRERAMREMNAPTLETAPSNAGPPHMTKIMLMNHIKGLKHLPPTVDMGAKKAVLLNLLLVYLDDADILREVWSAGIDDLGKALEAKIKK